MRNRLFTYFSILALLFGCATLKTKREVVDNILTSSYPKIRVKVDPSLTYLGDIQYSAGGYDVYEYHKTQHTSKAHAFVFVTAEESTIKKALIIRIFKQKGTRIWVADQTGHVKHILDQGNLRLAGKRFQYYSKVIKFLMDDPAVEYVYNKGYTTPNYALMTRVVRVWDLGKTLIRFDYYEDIPFSRFGYSSWRNKDDLYEEQLNWLEECKKHGMAAFEIFK